MSEMLLAVYPNEMEARLWAGILEQEGIRSMVRSQSGGNPFIGHISFVPHAIFVLEENIASARAIIEQVEGDEKA